MDSDLGKINEAMRSLRDHFESKGKKFIMAWWTEEGEVQNFNTISTSAKGSDYAEAILRWAGQLDEYIKEN